VVKLPPLPYITVVPKFASYNFFCKPTPTLSSFSFGLLPFRLYLKPRVMLSHREDESDGPSYSFWRHKLIPIIRVLMLLLATIFILLSVWLETSAHYDSPSSFINEIAMYTVKINSHTNLSDSYAAVPDTVSFGLWKHCFGYIDSFRCLDQNLLYGLGKVLNQKLLVGTVVLTPCFFFFYLT
jgi:hypothetical protein